MFSPCGETSIWLRAIDYAIKNQTPFLMISKSGGARMQEASLSLMQLVKLQLN